ncbi:type II toxin-antitoxin system HicB family antitoxin [Labrys monachus]|uniref:RNase H-like HicB family nuclease n=1 Tax=Labrys monachus TaxID=217067 RepID=A0ABU0FJ21_9HYPH|nr:type II toxin-antitoxin system HicB family antitoxin [Labrys monachus]MDQ0394618.1 putative RNase H-like HicB family nuclease [Labrys monachus]
MTKFIAIVDRMEGAYDVHVPDCPGCAAIGETENEAIRKAGAALSEWVGLSETTGLERPAPRTAEALRSDPHIIGRLAEGAVFAVLEVA